MDNQRANVILLCNTCGGTVEVLFGLPMIGDTGRVLTQSTAGRDHLNASPGCWGGTVTILAGEAGPEEYAALKTLMPGVPKLMLYPQE